MSAKCTGVVLGKQRLLSTRVLRLCVRRNAQPRHSVRRNLFVLCFILQIIMIIYQWYLCWYHDRSLSYLTITFISPRAFVGDLGQLSTLLVTIFILRIVKACRLIVLMSTHQIDVTLSTDISAARHLQRSAGSEIPVCVLLRYNIPVFLVFVYFLLLLLLFWLLLFFTLHHRDLSYNELTNMPSTLLTGLSLY